MKAKQIATWAVTGLVSLFFLFSGYMQIFGADALPMMRSFGYPDYISLLLGILKIAGAIVLLLPFWRLREWAYAGFAFLLVGATWSQLASMGFDAMTFAFMSVIFLVTAASWHLRQNHNG